MDTAQSPVPSPFPMAPAALTFPKGIVILSPTPLPRAPRRISRAFSVHSVLNLLPFSASFASLR
jgi:hypothetical protein